MSANPRVVLLIGVSGSGKTTVGRALADRLGWDFADADDFHSAEAMDQMSRGAGLTDADRAPWLARLAAFIRARVADDRPTVLACSALKEGYRQTLVGDSSSVSVVWLDVPREILRDRLTARHGHAVGADLLPSQLATFEPPTDAIRVDGTRAVADCVEQALAELA